MEPPITNHSTETLVGKRVLVTGATGFIGSRLALRLKADGAHVIGLCRNLDKSKFLHEHGIEVALADITDEAGLDALCSRQIDIVMHLAAWMRGKSYSEADRINQDATRCFAELSAKYSISRFVYVSSIAVYGMHGDNDVDEATPVHSYNDPYGDSKIRGETVLQQVAERTRLPTVIVRPGMVYGPGSPGWSRRMARWARAGLMPLVDGGEGSAYPVYIDNLIDLLILCATHPKAIGETFNAVDDGRITMKEFGGRFMQMVPTDRALRLPGWLVKTVALVVNPFIPYMNVRYVANQLSGRGLVLNLKAKTILDWEPTISFEEGMRRSEAWLHQEGML